MRAVTLYSKPDCHLCVQAREALLQVREALLELRSGMAFELLEVDITTDEALHRAYFERIPVVFLDGEELFEYFVDQALLEERLGSIL